MKRATVMSRNGRITKPAKKAKSIPTREWFERQVAELGELLEKMPISRRRAFESDVLRPKQ